MEILQSRLQPIYLNEMKNIYSDIDHIIMSHSSSVIERAIDCKIDGIFIKIRIITIDLSRIEEACNTKICFA